MVAIQEKVIDGVGGTTNSKLYLSNYYGIGFATNRTDPGSEADIDLYISGSGSSDGSGYVGIGTTTPSEKLEVNDGAILVSNSINGREIKLDAGNGAIDLVNGTFQINRFSTNNIALAGGGGNVGIGTITPSQKFEVVDGSTTISQYFRIRDFDDPTNEDTNALTRIISRDGNTMFWNGGVVMGAYANDQLGDVGDGSLIVRNKVGIGTTTPDAKLAVNGNIHTKEVKVDLNGWPDYVFAKDYNLPTLVEVEKHIQEKGHLKDIPSAQDVETNGLYLGEINAKLLQKIEELTLYTIEQEKKLAQQEKDIQTQSLRIQELEKENTRLGSVEKRLDAIEKLIKTTSKK